MKRILIIVGIVFGVFLIIGIIGYLQSVDVIPKFKWQGLAMIFAAAAGPFKILFNKFKGNEEQLNNILTEHDEIKKQEIDHRIQIDQTIKEKEEKIKKMEEEIKTKDSMLEQLKVKEKNIVPEINNMSDKEKQEEAQRVWG